MHILYPSLSLFLTAFLSLNSVNVILSKLWSRHGVGSEAICPVIALVSDSWSFHLSDYDGNNPEVNIIISWVLFKMIENEQKLKRPKLCHS